MHWVDKPDTCVHCQIIVMVRCLCAAKLMVGASFSIVVRGGEHKSLAVRVSEWLLVPAKASQQTLSSSACALVERSLSTSLVGIHTTIFSSAAQYHATQRRCSKPTFSCRPSEQSTKYLWMKGGKSRDEGFSFSRPSVNIMIVFETKEWRPLMKHEQNTCLSSNVGAHNTWTAWAARSVLNLKLENMTLAWIGMVEVCNVWHSLSAAIRVAQTGIQLIRNNNLQRRRGVGQK